MKKKKYAATDMYEDFHRLLMKLSPSVDPGAFIVLQDSLLDKVGDKSSHEAETIMQRKIDFFRKIGQPKKAWDVIEGNIQIENFCEKTAEKRIAEKDFAGAKRLINDWIEGPGFKKSPYHLDRWKELLLDIARKEVEKNGPC